MEISELKGVGPKLASLFKKIGVMTTDDLIGYYPFRYDLIKRSNIDELIQGDKIIIDGTVESNPSLFFFNKKMNKMSFKLNTGNYLVDGAGVDLVDDERVDAGLVVQHADGPVEISVAVGDVKHLGGIHVQGSALADVAGGTIRDVEGCHLHCWSLVNLGKSDDDAAGGQVDGSLIVVECQSGDHTVAGELQVACVVVGARPESASDTQRTEYI